MVLELPHCGGRDGLPGGDFCGIGIDPARRRCSVLLDLDFLTAQMEEIPYLDTGLAHLDWICCPAHELPEWQHRRS